MLITKQRPGITKKYYLLIKNQYAPITTLKYWFTIKCGKTRIIEFSFRKYEDTKM